MRRAFFALLFLLATLHAEEREENTYTINFHDVPVVEFIQFVSRISDVNFIFNHRDLQFNISLASGKPVSPDHVVRALVQILRAHGYSIAKEDGYMVIHKGVMEKELGMPEVVSELRGEEQAPPPLQTKPEFLVYKLQYHPGEEVEETIRKISTDLSLKPQTSPLYLEALKSVQWIKATNSLVCSGDQDSLQAVKELIQSLDTELRQVYIELLVIETDAKNSHEFGLQWGAGGNYKNRVGFGQGQFNPNPGGGASPFQLSFENTNAQNRPTGPNQLGMGSGFDMGVIGDLIFHRGRSFVSLGALVSALQTEGTSTIVLNQKIITQDNKNSKIFVGDNIPFTGSIVTTVGTNQQSTANVEYRDIGVNLSITPRLGEGDIITLDLNEEITEAIPAGEGTVSNSQVTGIQTTKTNMMTHVHVPDRHFLVLSGMMRNAKSRHKSGLPCLGAIPGLGDLLFNKTNNASEKRSVIIFVRPHIIRSMDDYRRLTEDQSNVYRENAVSGALDEALLMAK
jgi:type III secretion protein C